MFVALDISTHCGWAAVDKHGQIHHGTFHIPGPQTPNRLVAFKHFLDGLLYQFKPEVVAHEAQFFKGHGSHLLIYLAGIVNLAAQERGAAVYPHFTNNQIKKAFTGSGKADKAKMIQTCQKLGLNPCDDNAADAIALIAMCLANAATVKNPQPKKRKPRKKKK